MVHQKRQRLACFRAFVHESRDATSQPTQGRECDEPLLAGRRSTTPHTMRIVRIALGTSLCVHAGERYAGILSLPPCGRDYWCCWCYSRFARRAKPVCAQRTAQSVYPQLPSMGFSGQSSLSRARSRVQGSHARSLSHHHCRAHCAFLEPYQRQKWALPPLVPDSHHPPPCLSLSPSRRGPLYTSPREGGGSTCNKVAHTSVSTLSRWSTYIKSSGRDAGSEA